MVEAIEESSLIPTHRQRTTLFLSAMRHRAMEIAEAGMPLRYVALDEPANTGALASELGRAIEALRPERVIVMRPGDWRVLRSLEAAAAATDTPLEMIEDPSFLSSIDEFSSWREGRKTVVMDHFYRVQRKRHEVLMESDGTPIGGKWSHDASNRSAFKSEPSVREPWFPDIDDITREVMALVTRELPEAPGRLERFVWATTSKDARRMLDDFIEHRLPEFGRYQDAMWTGQPFLNHSLISPAINLQLLDPRECIDAAVSAYEAGDAPIESVEGFVRQILGWREFIRGVYWTEGADYVDRNELESQGTLPEWYWTGDTDLECLRDSIGQVVEYGYGHHIQRLMVTGNFALIAGIDPRAISDWYVGMFVDAVDWVTVPNTVGMVMHADGGVVGTKPYAASANYIGKMSNHCKNCSWDRKARSGDEACPFNVFYWDFLIRQRERLRGNRRMAIMLKNVDRLDPSERERIVETAAHLRDRLGISTATGGA